MEQLLLLFFHEIRGNVAFKSREWNAQSAHFNIRKALWNLHQVTNQNFGGNNL